MTDEMTEGSEEQERILRSYRSRTQEYSLFQPWVRKTIQGRERAWLRLLERNFGIDLSDKEILEIGCGQGDNLIFMLRLGADPSRICGNELIPERATEARRRLPASVQILEGSAEKVAIEGESLDIVIVSMVISSILASDLRQDICQHLWTLIRPGGGVLWYDFEVNNPTNTDVRGVSLNELRLLFPTASFSTIRITLAPPISRSVTRVHESLYDLFHLFPFFRSHRACWLAKER